VAGTLTQPLFSITVVTTVEESKTVAAAGNALA
jgi:hypothetical protein